MSLHGCFTALQDMQVINGQRKHMMAVVVSWTRFDQSFSLIGEQIYNLLLIFYASL
jgi:hypothetical protein